MVRRLPFSGLLKGSGNGISVSQERNKDMAIRKPTVRIPEALVGLAEKIASGLPASDWKDNAANLCAALEEAGRSLGMKNVLDAAGMPDGFSCPRAFLDWKSRTLVARPVRRKTRTRLRGLATGRSSKWAAGYVRALGILEHLDECRTLKSRWDELKAEMSPKSHAVAAQLDRELADLWCILEMRRLAEPDWARTCAERARKFRP